MVREKIKRRGKAQKEPLSPLSPVAVQYTAEDLRGQAFSHIHPDLGQGMTDQVPAPHSSTAQQIKPPDPGQEGPKQIQAQLTQPDWFAAIEQNFGNTVSPSPIDNGFFSSNFPQNLEPRPIRSLEAANPIRSYPPTIYGVLGRGESDRLLDPPKLGMMLHDIPSSTLQTTQGRSYE
jgi:hypothetical protein